MLTISGICPRRSIHAARARPARRLALAQADDQLLAQLTDRQSIDGVVDRLATDVGISEVGYVHAAQLAGNLFGRQTLTQHMSHQLEALTTRKQLSHRSTNLAAGLHLLLGHTGRVTATGISIAAQFPADGRRGSGDQAGNPAQAEALRMTDLNGGALFNAEFGIRHRDSTVPERSGVALSFCRRHASSKMPTCAFSPATIISIATAAKTARRTVRSGARASSVVSAPAIHRA